MRLSSQSTTDSSASGMPSARNMASAALRITAAEGATDTRPSTAIATGTRRSIAFCRLARYNGAMFQKILIADRGESALRIARTCERMGVATIAICTPEETSAPHVTACAEVATLLPDDEAGGPQQRAAELIAAAKTLGAQAIHPGTSPLSCSSAFAQATAEAGLVFVGCPAQALARFADIDQTRALAEAAGAHVLPSALVDPSDHAAAIEHSTQIGFPLAVRLPNGVTMGTADFQEELFELLQKAHGRAVQRVRLEHVIERPRLLSVHVIADAASVCVPLGEVEHSLVARGQALLVESPAPALTSLPNRQLKRDTLWSVATAAALEGGLVGSAAIELALDPSSRIHFLRVRPGLPPSHALSEVCGNVDLVEAELRIAAGEGMPTFIRCVQPSGHAIEARLMLAPGTSASDAPVTALHWPVMPKGALRIETALAVGQPVRVDPAQPLARIIAHGQTRHQALLTLDRVIAEAVVEPASTNAAGLRLLLADESYRAGQYDDAFIDRTLPPAAA